MSGENRTEADLAKRKMALGVLWVALAIYAPYSWILLLLHHRNEWLKLWIALPGLIPAQLLGMLGISDEQIRVIGPILAVALPCLAIFLVLCFWRRRKLVSAVTLALSCVPVSLPTSSCWPERTAYGSSTTR